MALTQIPSFFSPGAYFLVDPTQATAGVVELPNSTLYIGCRLSTGTVAQNIPRRLTSRAQANREFGEGSMVAQMANVGWDATDSGDTLQQWALGIDASGTAATGDITFAGLSTEAGTLRWEVGGRKMFVSVPNGTAAAAVAALMVAFDHTGAAATGADGGATYNVTARHEIEEGNNIDLRVTEIPEGLTYVITAMSGGATNPSIAAALAAIAALRPQRIVLGFSDTANVDLLVADLTTRDTWANEAFCRGFIASISDAATVNALASGYNSPYLSITAYNAAASTPWEVAAWMTMVNARRSGSDPSANRNGLTGTKGVLSGPRLEDRSEFSEWESMLSSGVAVITMDDFGDPKVHRHVTTYTVNGDGAVDQTYRDASVVTTVWAIRYTLDVFLSARWKDAKLDEDGTEPPPGAKLLTPSKLRNEYALAWDMLWAPKVWVKLSKRDEYVETMASEINADDLTRADGAVFPRVISPLNQIATTIAFRR